jgi:hypothetical protein
MTDCGAYRATPESSGQNAAPVTRNTPHRGMATTQT